MRTVKVGAGLVIRDGIRCVENSAPLREQGNGVIEGVQPRRIREMKILTSHDPDRNRLSACD